MRAFKQINIPWKDLFKGMRVSNFRKFKHCVLTLFVIRLWSQLKSILSNDIIFAISTPQTAIFGFWQLDTNEHLTLNQLLLIFKMYIYNTRAAGYLNISHLMIYIRGIKGTVKKI